MYKKLLAICFLLASCFSAKQVFAQYQLNGNTVQTSCNCYRLTTASNAQNGSVWNVNLFDLSTPFDFTFDVFLGCSDGGADGVAFVLQPLSTNAGSAGGGLGYAGINPSVAVEMDTYQNGGEPSFDHIGIQANGSVVHSGANSLAGPVPISSTSANVEDCGWHLLNVTWNPVTMVLAAYFDGVLRLSYTGDIINNIFGGNPNVYWGLTAATGGANNLQQFCNALSPSFTVDPTQQCMGDVVQFQSTSTVATSQITNFEWDFGDGTTGTGTSPTHIYTTDGNYLVSLTITSEGCSESSSASVTINPLPVASVGSDLTICAGESVQLSPTNLTVGASYQWTPATGLDNAAIAAPNATPSATATYTLQVTSTEGCVSSDALQLTVNPLPVADAGTDLAVCDGNSIPMNGLGGVTYSWNPTTDLANATSATTAVTPTATTVYTLTVTDVNNCTDMDDMTLTINPLPNTNAGTDNSMCDEQTVQLVGTGALNYTWNPTANLDDATAATPTFSGNSTTTFTLTGIDVNGCISTDNVTVTVFSLPVADFASPLDVCLGNPTEFVSNSAGNGLLYQWNFGNASALDANINPTYTYASATTFNVNLSVTDSNGCQNDVDGTATVLALPFAAINIASGSGYCEGDPIQFENESTGGTDVFWNFGDNAFLPWLPNTTSMLNNPEFTYNNFAFGPYTVSLSITDAAGCYDETTTTIVVYDRPTADFSFSIACQDDPTQLTDASTVLDFSSINNWQWDMGDGSPVLATQNPSYGYALAENYAVQLIATTENGCADTLKQNLWVNPTPVISIAGIDVCLEVETAFENNSSPQDETIVLWDWDLGDGSSSENLNPTNTYLNHGQFLVSLTATTDSGCVAWGTTSVTVFPNPEPVFQIIDAVGCTPHTVQFIDASTIATGFNSEFTWDFGNGMSAEGEAVSTVYQDSGFYNITLAVTSAEGCNTTLLRENVVRANITPVAEFRMNNNLFSLLDARLQITNLSLHALEWAWRFGNGTSSILPNPEHQYNDVGEYEVVLTVFNGDCEDTQIQRLRVEPIFTFYIPSAFTPNSDSHNEFFFGQGEGFSAYNLRIFTRWGQLLFESNAQSNGWNGSYLGKPVEAGIYIYEFSVLDLNAVSHRYSGGVTLLR